MNDVPSILETSAERFRQQLVSLATLSRDQQILAFLKYEATFRPNFIAWLAAVERRCPDGSSIKLALSDNLTCEREQDHPSMLANLVGPLHREVGKCLKLQTDLETALAMHRPYIEAVDEICRHAPIIDAAYVPAALERLSLVFIPVMSEAADFLQLPDQTYLRVHGEADEEHAKQLQNGAHELAAQYRTLPSQETVLAVEQLILSALSG